MNKFSRQWAFEIYTYFGRVLKEFPIPDDETHHATAEKAMRYGIQKEKEGTKCWIRLRK